MSVRVFLTGLLFFSSLASAGQWQRRLVTEPRPDGRTLLLVIDVPNDPQLLQQVVFRKSFARAERMALLAAQKRFSDVHRSPFANQSLRVLPHEVWPNHPWTAQDEDNYSKWIEKTASESYLEGGGVDVDCADYAMAMRWIYAHDHQLAVGDSLAVTGRLVGSWETTPDWDKLPTNSDWRQDARFKAVLKYVLDNSFTHSLLNDLYPVSINKDFVKPGTVYLTLFQDSGHTRTIFNIGNGPACDDGKTCISIIWGNEPASEEGFVTKLVPWKLLPEEGGFLRFRWPEQTAGGDWQLRAPDAMPGYSLEQYQWSEGDYLPNVSSRLGLWSSPEERYVELGGIAASGLADRLQSVEIGYFMCSIVPCAPNDAVYNEWSTPQRDHTLAREIGAFQNVSGVDPTDEAILFFRQRHNVDLFPGSSRTILNILDGSDVNEFVGDPTVDFFARWGMSTPYEDDRLHALAQIAFDNWQWREKLVDAAQLICYPAGDNVKKCDPADARLQKLATTRLDQAFRTFQASFVQQWNAADSDTQQEITDLLKTQQTAEAYCGANKCTMYDYLVASPQHLATMSSAPDAPLASRFGF